MPIVWIGAAGTATAYGLIRAVTRAWPQGVRVIAADTNPPQLVAASSLAAESVVVPPVAHPDFDERLIGGLSRTHADTYVPLLDAEILRAAELRDAGLIPESVRYVKAPSAESSRLCLDKLEMDRFLTAHQLPVPETWGHDDYPRDGRPLIVKPRQGLGSVGVRRLDAAERVAPDELVQEVCDPPEVTVDAFRARRGALRMSVCRERLQVKAGVATKARVFQDAELAELAHRLGDRLDLGGTYCFQTMRDGNGAWAITDVNARPGGATAMSVAVGADVLAADLADLWGEDPLPFLRPPERPRIVVRAYTELVMD
jgi:carbamoylphosphate synthase large subunit